MTRFRTFRWIAVAAIGALIAAAAFVGVKATRVVAASAADGPSLCPRIEDPDPIEDAFAWFRIFRPKYAEFDGVVYGVNIWRVGRDNLVASIKNMIDQGAAGLEIGGGRLHALDIYPDATGETQTVVLIYEWRPNLTADLPFYFILTPIYFLHLVDAYNWTLVSALEPDLSVYADMIDARFHGRYCRDRDGSAG